MPGVTTRDPAVTLGSRTFIGLLLAQFTATFNDQATHMVAIFFASDLLTRYIQSPFIDKKAVVAIVTACFMAPFFVLSPLSGTLADRYSKRSIIVFWKVFEVLVMVLALGGLAIPAFVGEPGPSPALATLAAMIMIATVFLMGLHSTFFVPAKYGIMPEILDPSVLSRGNGFLEGTSFMAQIFGTSAGGILYAFLKSKISPGSMVPGEEWVIGLLLLVLAAIGTGTAALMTPVPAAAPDRKMTREWWGPLRTNLGILLGAKPLTLALIGVTFVAFMTLFLRQTLLYEAELRQDIQDKAAIVAEAEGQSKPLAKPTTPAKKARSKEAGGKELTWREKLSEALQESELQVALLIAIVGFGVGVGSVAAGYVSGDHVELGMVLPGAVGMIILTGLMTLWMASPKTLVLVLLLLGTSAGFVLVPLYTQLQHRAPRESKGNVIAAANFVYVCAGLVAVVLFYVSTFVLERVFGHLDAQMRVPRVLMFMTCGFTVLMLIALCLRQPDLLLRTALWIRRSCWRTPAVRGCEHLPAREPVIVSAKVCSVLDALQVSVTGDRYNQLVVIESAAAPGTSALRLMARLGGVLVLRETASAAAWQQAMHRGSQALANGDLTGVAWCPQETSAAVATQIQAMLDHWRNGRPGIVVIDVSAG